MLWHRFLCDNRNLREENFLAFQLALTACLAGSFRRGGARERPSTRVLTLISVAEFLAALVEPIAMTFLHAVEQRFH